MIIFPNIEWYLINLLNTILLFVIILIFNPELIKRKNIIIISIISIITSGIDYYVDGTSLITSFILTMYIFYNTEHKTIYKVIMFLASLLLISFTQGISNYIVIKLFKFGSCPTVLQAIWPTFFIIVINYAFSLFPIYIFKTIKLSTNNLRLLVDKKISIIILLALIIIITSYLGVITLFNYFILSPQNITLTIISSTILLLLVLVVTFLLISNRLRNIKFEAEIRNINEKNIYIKELERRNDELRRFKHDYKNFLLSLSASLKSNDIKNESINKLLEYADNNVDSILPVESSNLFHLKDNLVRGILITKLVAARNKHINTNFEIDSHIQIPEKDSIELTRILGILLDNSIESSLLASNPKINFAIVSFEHYIEFIVENSISSKEDIDLNNMYSNGFTTKENHQGIGLSTVKKIVNNHNDIFLQTKIKKGLFTTILTVLDDE